MYTDKIKVFGSKVRVESTAKVTEKEKMRNKADLILKHNINFINRCELDRYASFVFVAIL